MNFWCVAMNVACAYSGSFLEQSLSVVISIIINHHNFFVSLFCVSFGVTALVLLSVLKQEFPLCGKSVSLILRTVFLS